MSTPPACRLWILFAERASVAVIVRQGPRLRTQLVLWHTDTDAFSPGQWIKGKIEYASLSPNGSHMAMAITPEKMRDQPSLTYSVVSRPPYFTALAISFHLLNFGRDIFFDMAGTLMWDTTGPIEWRAEDRCPFKLKMPRLSIEKDIYESTVEAKKDDPIWLSPQGRRFMVDEGKLYDLDGKAPRLLIDLENSEFEPIEAPPWAKLWNASPPGQ